MNNREHQKKFADQSNIRNSEFDRINTNATRYSNPLMRGKNPLPPDTERREKVYLKEQLLKIVSAGMGVLFFIFIVPLARFFVSEAFYSGIIFLFGALMVTVLVAVGSYYLGKKLFN
ncbi:hypothetical protein [Enterococcus rivorum]|uniref:Uncharacterized protein n=1 Tax=Enterococcus rivorum TaxID=762845 RepID=A0A1E5KWA0_9ENTE|nr:hypothetical protein [Enterococcus rivorum]MBP2100088.1 hypothetical protein [Enterococcus rivorum]OEH82131.1 hypothetical protein BCR26_14440 [Enterococcus rivorum]